jgi:hypothetical protein
MSQQFGIIMLERRYTYLKVLMKRVRLVEGLAVTFEVMCLRLTFFMVLSFRRGSFYFIFQKLGEKPTSWSSFWGGHGCICRMHQIRHLFVQYPYLYHNSSEAASSELEVKLGGIVGLTLWYGIYMQYVHIGWVISNSHRLTLDMEIC